MFNNREEPPWSVCYIRPPSSRLAKHLASTIYLRTSLSPYEFDSTSSAKDAGLFDHSLCNQCSSYSHITSTCIVTTSSFEHYSPCIKFKQATPKLPLPYLPYHSAHHSPATKNHASSHKIPDPVVPAPTPPTWRLSRNCIQKQRRFHTLARKLAIEIQEPLTYLKLMASTPPLLQAALWIGTLLTPNCGLPSQ